jgi:hypothetical protein
MLVCVLDPDALFPVLIAVKVVAELDTTAELEVGTAAELEVDDTARLEVGIAAELEGLVDATAELGVASPAAPSTKPQVGAAGPAVALAHTSITH